MANDFPTNCRKLSAQAFQDLCTVRTNIHQHIAVTSCFSKELKVQDAHSDLVFLVTMRQQTPCTTPFQCLSSMNCHVLRRLSVARDRFPLSLDFDFTEILHSQSTTLVNFASSTGRWNLRSPPVRWTKDQRNRINITTVGCWEVSRQAFV